jgi:Cof subfamily protein (haloacid dehalogenase superfamily)
MADFRNVLIATDLDGTFFGIRTRLVERNLQAVEKFKTLGGHFTAATGRIRQNITRSIPQYRELFNAPLITANGAYVWDGQSDRAISKTAMDPTLVRDVVRYVHELHPDVGVRVSTETGFLADINRMPPVLQYDLGRMTNAEAVLLPVDEWEIDGAQWFKIVVRGDAADLATVRPLVEARFGDALEYSTSSPTFYELQAKGCTKASAMRLVADRLAAELGHPILTVAVGDHENDLPMLRAADLAGCPENALDAVQAATRFHLCHCDEGAIADLIEKLAVHLGVEM